MISMFNILADMRAYGFEKAVLAKLDNRLKTIIAIHSTKSGPALGGVRMLNYPDFESALVDVYRLARSMTKKAAAARLPLGGGKAVIIGDPEKEKSEEILHAFGELVESLGGQYITAEDSGINQKDIEVIAQKTKYACGLKKGNGSPSLATATSVLEGIRIASRRYLSADSISDKGSLEGLVVSILGVGKVGSTLAELLVDQGAKVYIADIDKNKVETVASYTGATVVDCETIYSLPCDIFSPCALGNSINQKTIPLIKAKIIAGAENNQLSEPFPDSLKLKNLNIVYCPDFIINCGGLILVAGELPLPGLGYNREEAIARAIEAVDYSLNKVFDIAEENDISTYQAAIKIFGENSF
jgi:leucine dehydrogenase